MANYTPNYNLKKPLQTENYNIDDQNGNMDIIDSAISGIAPVIKNDVTIAITGWMLDSVSGLYKYHINDADITANDVVNVNIKVADLEKAEDFKSANESFLGYVEIYSSSIPTDSILCDLVITKAVV